MGLLEMGQGLSSARGLHWCLHCQRGGVTLRAFRSWGMTERSWLGWDVSGAMQLWDVLVWSHRFAFGSSKSWREWRGGGAGGCGGKREQGETPPWLSAGISLSCRNHGGVQSKLGDKAGLGFPH